MPRAVCAFAFYWVCAVSVLPGHCWAAEDHVAVNSTPVPATIDFASTEGAISFDFDPAVLDELGWSLAVRSALEESSEVRRAAFTLSENGFLSVDRHQPAMPSSLELRTGGGLLISKHGQRYTVLTDLTLRKSEEGSWSVVSAPGVADEEMAVFHLTDLVIDFLPAAGKLRLAGQLSVTAGWARDLGTPDLAGRAIGVLTLEASLRKADALDAGGPDEDDGTSAALSATAGPDVIVGELHDVSSYGTLGFSGIYAFAVGTISCNQGDTPVSWFANTNEHPVIGQNMYRWKNGRFEQIGMSWLKHGFLAVRGNTCQFGCTPPPLDGQQLGVGCSDPYSAGLNGQQSNLGPRSQVNPNTGSYPYPYSAPGYSQTIGRRLQVHEDDLDPALNAGALYFVEGHYVTADDALAGNQNNNASYRRATITASLNHYELGLSGITARRSPAIKAWQDYDPTVVETDIEVPNEGLFIVAAKVTDLGNGFWQYEYAVQNLNSDRAAQAFSVPIDPGATVFNVGFHDVDYHSGEPYASTDWSFNQTSSTASWSTETHASNTNANALRWGTLYNFRMDVNRPPSSLPATITLFKPGLPNSVTGLTLVPATPPPQCGNGSIESGEQCDPPDGVLCNSGCQTIVNNAYRGGLLWDKWWAVAGAAVPTGDHPLYPQIGQQSGSATFRCVECHGWDYDGATGAYGAGPHFTGIDGVRGSAMPPLNMFNLIKQSNVTNGHGFGALGLADQDIRDLVQFIRDLTIDTDVFVAANGAFLGNPAAGQTNYTSGGSTTCITCHGAEGANINFGTPLNPEWVGTVAVNNPWELLHKVRFGNPGSAMPSWLLAGGTNQGAADIGRYAQLNLRVVCSADAHCNDAKYCNGVETCSGGACVAGVSPCPNQPCDEFGDVCGVADAFRGGLLYDNWLSELEITPPPGDHPLYPPAGQQSGPDTFRCVECHGWDYKGANGAYASGPHATGIGGVFNTSLTAGQMFTLLKEPAPPDGHGFGAMGLSDNDIWDLAAFVEQLVIDTDPYIDANADFVGNETLGQQNFESGGGIACMVCHGADGTDLNFGTSMDPEWIGTVAVNDPWRLLHKIRIGNAGGPMPSWAFNGGTDQAAADIGRYAQLNLPVECFNDAHCDDGLFCTGVETCINGFCVAGSDPCPGGVCDETTSSCLSGLCAPPVVIGDGPRNIKLVPVADTTPIAFLVTGLPTDGVVSCVSQYVQLDGSLGVSPVFQTPAQWGTVHIADEAIRPSADYRIRGDCGSPGNPDITLPADARTWKWGDVNNNTFVNVSDIQLIVKAVQQDYSLVTLERADLLPCQPNRLVNVSDVQAGVLAFQHLPLTAVNCPDPCP